MNATQSGFGDLNGMDTLGALSTEIFALICLAESAHREGDVDSARKIGVSALRKCLSLGPVLEVYLGVNGLKELRDRARRVGLVMTSDQGQRNVCENVRTSTSHWQDGLLADG